MLHYTMSDRPTPFDGLDELFDQLNRRLETAARTWQSEIDDRSRLDLSMSGGGIRLDLTDHGDEFVATVDVPGYESDDLEIRLRDDALAISGERQQTFEESDGVDEHGGLEGSEHDLEGEPETTERDETHETSEPEGTYIRRERELQSFSRQVRLPDPVDTDAATATVNNGVLTVRLPKLESDGETRTIDID
ncbi:heat shock protein Hsp20 [Haloterrigena turkmenica DSM 5511]|uniref:Heat shock protein Hsp20 n=2 Tax=Haloterrigena turkmenica TaxID=62320 RepID=D2RSN7_HALTV|nr:heat shock protein Hsp20 [Haloterrigena turkmenica DSM 5511]